MRLILPIILILGSAAAFFFVTKPKLDVIRTLSSDISVYNDALNNVARLNSVKDALLVKFNQFPAAGLARLEKLVPDTIDNVRLIIDINGIARDHGLQLRGLRVTSGPATGSTSNGTPGVKKYDSVSVSFSVTTSFDQFRSLVTDLERSMRIMDVTNLTFTASDTDDYDFTIALKTYWLK